MHIQKFLSITKKVPKNLTNFYSYDIIYVIYCLLFFIDKMTSSKSWGHTSSHNYNLVINNKDTVENSKGKLKLLRQAKLIKPRKVGKEVFYSLDDEHVSLIFNCALAHVKE